MNSPNKKYFLFSDTFWIAIIVILLSLSASIEVERKEYGIALFSVLMAIFAMILCAETSKNE
jgi:hypothetical protein